MEDLKKKMSADMNDKEIVFSKSIKAGKRIYYLDVKKNRKDEMFLAITESKKVITGEGDDSQVSFEKHKIFLYREDFQKFMAGLEEAVNFIECSDANEYIARLNIEADEENRTQFMEPLDPFTCEVEDAIKRIKDAGIVGMGGASFPTFVKLNPPEDKEIEYVLLNAAECEPYLTCDERTLQEMPEKVIDGLAIELRLVALLLWKKIKLISFHYLKLKLLKKVMRMILKSAL